LVSQPICADLTQSMHDIFQSDL